MKSLKLEHQLANDVLAGKKTSTWRINDDKDLHVNDVIQLVDKVKSNDPATWQVIGEATITAITEKKMGNIVQGDLQKGELLAPLEERLKAFQGYYGPQVGAETPVKIINFDFKPVTVATSTGQSALHLKLYADGGSRGNPGLSASGYVLLDLADKIVVENGLFLGVTTNNQAEYTALKIGLEDALQRGVRQLDVYMDSLLVINQMKGLFKVKNRDLLSIHLSIKELATRFEKISYTHVPRELNKLADGMVNQVLDASIK
jgi:ribonuclease HI